MKKICKYCEEKFIEKKKDTIYCSPKCGQRYWQHRCTEREYKKSRYKKCIVCGKEFYSKTGTAKFCSNKCQMINCGQLFSPYKKYHCKLCGNEFRPSKEKGAHWKYCSDECYRIGKGCHVNGKRISNSDEYNKYKLLLIERSELKCKNCGINIIWTTKGNLFCSVKCRGKYYYDNGRDLLSDDYIKTLIKNKGTLKYKDTPSELVELKRTQLKLHRFIYNV